MYFSRNVSTKIKFNLKMKNDMAGNCQSVFLLRLLLKTNFNFITLYKLIITKLQLILVLNFFFSWPKTAIVDVYNTCNGDTDIYAMGEIHSIKTYKKRERVIAKAKKNYETWIKKRMHGKSFRTK